MRAYHDAEGLVLYTLTGDLTPPGSWIEIEDQDLGDLTAWRVIEGELVRVSIEPLKAEARARLAAAIAAARTALITDLPGQEMIYLAKEAEARDWLSATDPDLADYTLLSAEVGITAPDADSLAQLWLNLGQLWRGAAAQLEALRMSILAAIDAAETPADIEAALTALQTISLGDHP